MARHLNIGTQHTPKRLQGSSSHHGSAVAGSARFPPIQHQRHPKRCSQCGAAWPKLSGASSGRSSHLSPRQRARAACRLPPCQLSGIQVCGCQRCWLIEPRRAHAGGAAQREANQVDGGPERAVPGLLVALVGSHGLGAAGRRSGGGTAVRALG